MSYYIINKIEENNGQLIYTPIGYVTEKSDRDAINSKYESTFGAWVESNKSELENGSIYLSDYFILDSNVHSCKQKMSSIEGMGLSEITDITPYV